MMSLHQAGEDFWTAEDFWIDSEPSSSSSSPVTAKTVRNHVRDEEADGPNNHHQEQQWKDDTELAEKAALKEKNWRRSARGGGGYKHVPHKDKPPQVVAKRNARERRRVQAVNGAFLRLRRAVPIENTRGKRVSKVKTLQNAIDYINGLKKLLEEDGHYHHLNIYSNYRYANNAYTFLEELQEFDDEI